MSAFLQERIDHHLKLYRDFIRPLMIDGHVFHHTPFIKHTQLTTWCVLEYASVDGARAVAGVFRTGDVGERVYHLVPRGLDASHTYRVTLDSRAQTLRLSGTDLILHGLDLRLELPQSSELVLFQMED
jgi:Glycosyl hydrolase family 36 C-terminal domain